MKTVAIVQARTGSTRLPRKILLELAGEPMLLRVLQRLRGSETLDEIIVATTTLEADDTVEAFCKKYGWLCSRGSEMDVLDRYYQAALHHSADTIVRITSDCPLIDPQEVDRVVRAFRETDGADYASNTLEPRTLPRGLDVEVFSFTALERAWQQDHDPASREHVTAFIYRHPEQFRLTAVPWERDLSSYRWTVDTVEDLALARKIYAHFGAAQFTWQQSLAACEAHPDWSQLNQHIEQKHLPPTP